MSDQGSRKEQISDQGSAGKAARSSDKMALFIDEMRALEETIAREKDVSTGLRAQMKEIQAHYDGLLNHAGAQSRQLLIDKDKLEKLLAAHQGQIRNLETRCGGAVEENKGLKAQVAKYATAIQGLERHNKHLTDQCATQGNRIPMLESQLDQAARDQASILQSAQEEQIRRKELESENAELKTKLEDARERLHSAQLANQAIQKEHRLESERGVDLKNELMSCAQTLDATTRELREAQARVRDYAERVEALQSYQASVAQMVRDIEKSTEERFKSQSIDNIELVKDVLRQELERGAEAEQMVLKEQLTAVRREAERLQLENEHIRARNMESHARGNELESRARRLAERESLLSAEIRRLKAVYPLRDLLSSKEYEINRLRQDVERIPASQPEREKLDIILRSVIAQRDQIQAIVAESERRALDQDAQAAEAAEAANAAVTGASQTGAFVAGPEFSGNA